ncbi:sn-1-specific diacylglycerol lipase ABHD11-like [Centruroides vittatus]|uniref:sn-1-specific diacylglycerol lipase ABHD11-like n=1 Tax=Centruroides vittatus TaxID=120091 RepID=UPI00350F6DEC
MLKFLHSNKKWWRCRIILRQRLFLKNCCIRRFIYTSDRVQNSNEDRLKPVKLAFDSYQFTKATVPSSPVVILHGLLGSKSNWRSLSKEIARVTGTKIYAVDVRNHGESPHSTEFDYRHMAEDTIHFLKEMNIKKSLLVGHSMGGRISMFVALSKPELVERLVVVDVSPINVPSDFHAEIFQYLQAMKLSLKQLPKGVSLSDARQLINNYLVPVVPNIATRQFLLTNLMEINKEVKWRCNLDVILDKFVTGVSTFPPVTAKFDKDTLFICGERSPYVSKEDHEKIRSIFPKVKFSYVEGAGHWVHSEKPSEFLKLLIGFIQNKTD